jgi:tRNA/tmRNA/rRNA uracil-C5-methylase (TrmA/RlmC/RlmD family)
MFLRHTLPGERVRVRVTEERARYLRGDAVEVLRASPDRVATPCPYAGPGRCGGCDWQHVDIAAQRRLKAAVIREQFARLAGLDVTPEVREVPGAPDGLGWRTRVGFAVGEGGAVGFRRHRSHAVEPVERCRIAHPLVNDLGVPRRRWLGVESVAVAVGAASGDRLVTPAGQPPPAGVIREYAAGRSWRVSAGSFWQVHPGAADALVDTVAALVQPRPGERALDLYCGVGLFAGALADRVGEAGGVLAVEGNRRAVADARHNLAGLPQVRVQCARVDGPLLRRLAAAHPRPDVVVLDPPRSGAGRDVVTELARIGPRAVGYVACDPAALARDVATFTGLGYRLAGLRAFDAFPMTSHVECVALLVSHDLFPTTSPTEQVP